MSMLVNDACQLWSCGKGRVLPPTVVMELIYLTMLKYNAYTDMYVCVHCTDFGDFEAKILF